MNDVSPVTLPGDITSPVAGLLLRRGCIVRDNARPLSTGTVTRDVLVAGFFRVSFEYGGFDGVARPTEYSIDISDPAGMDRAARWLAAHYGLAVGATAPDFGRYVCGEHCADGDTGRMEACHAPIWSLMVSGLDPIIFADCNGEDGDDRCHVPSISALTDPAEAMRAACLAAVGRTE